MVELTHPRYPVRWSETAIADELAGVLDRIDTVVRTEQQLSRRLERLLAHADNGPQRNDILAAKLRIHHARPCNGKGPGGHGP